MYYRLLVPGIVAFWLGMTLLLLRLETGHGARPGFPVSPAYVARLVFAREEASSLTLHGPRGRLGFFHVQPSRLAADSDGGGQPLNQLSVIGNFTLSLPGLNPQPVVLHAVGKFDPENRLRRLEVSAQVREAKQRTPGTVLEFDGYPDTGRWHYALRQGGVTLKENTGILAELLDDPDLRAAGVDPALLASAFQGPAADLIVQARRASLRSNGEEVETLAVTLRHGGGFEGTVHVSPLGQILAVQTPLGYNLYDEAFTP